MDRVWSCGGGVQSAAIAALIVRGDIPVPELSVIADTGREATSTWDYFYTVLKPAFESIGERIYIIPHSFYPDEDKDESYNTVDLMSGKDKKTIVIPMHTAQGGGILPKYCSNEWKSRPVQRFIRKKGIENADLLIGFSIDELERTRTYYDSKPWQHIYPLIDLRMTRGDCMAVVEKMGWPEPPRSSCWMCPFRSSHEWRLLLDTDDFDKAVQLERHLQKLDKDVYFHPSKVNLDKVDFSDNQDDLFAKECNSGHCFT
jgi:hypothetical protein